MTDRYEESRLRFARDTEKHQMTVLHDEGVYRHVRFKAPGTGFYWYDLVTWPGYLSFTGDMTGYVFTRVHDMFEFFRGSARHGINPQYWAEKLATIRPDQAKTYSEDLYRTLVKEHFVDAVRCGDAPPGLGRVVRDRLLADDLATEFEDAARQALNAFEYKGFRFADTWEWDLRDWDWTFLWCCHAITAGVQRYDASKQQPVAASVR